MYGLRATTFPVDFVWFLIVLMVRFVLVFGGFVVVLFYVLVVGGLGLLVWQVTGRLLVTVAGCLGVWRVWFTVLVMWARTCCFLLIFVDLMMFVVLLFGFILWFLVARWVSVLLCYMVLLGLLLFVWCCGGLLLVSCACLLMVVRFSLITVCWFGCGGVLGMVWVVS